MASVQPVDALSTSSEPLVTTAGFDGSTIEVGTTITLPQRSATPVIDNKKATVVAVSEEVSNSRFDSSSTIPFWVDGNEVTASDTFDVISPINQKLLYKCSSASEQDVQTAVTSAEKAFKTWSQTKPSYRRDIFLKAAEIFAKRKDECYQYVHHEIGAPPVMFGFDSSVTIDIIKTIAGLIGPAVEGTLPTAADEGQSAFVYKEPYGVVLAIAPWNVPYILCARSFLAPLAMGNAVILKGSELSPGVYWALASVFHEAGLPAGCLNTIFHKPADAAKITTALVASPAIKKINFTGSTNVGSIIASQAGKHLKPVLMELGGKNPSIVCEDADVEAAAEHCARGSFLNSGQICMSTERIMVHEKVASEFKEAMKRHTDRMFTEKGLGIPQLVSALPVEKNKKLIADAIQKGAKAVYGDPSDEQASKTIMRPVIIEGVTEAMDIYHTESFGPTVSLIVVQSDEEAVRIANDTEYGLSSAVFTEDLRRGLRIARQLETGAVHINTMTVHDEPALPHGGAKKSGFGRFNGLPGLNEWVRTKTVTFKH